jgi:NhaP-type Na+/H+ or K+/H+ antiporter
MAAILALVVVLIAIGAVSLIEAWYAAHHEPTISEDVQRFNFAAGGQIVAGLSFLFGFAAGWFITHFNDVP